MITCRVPLPLQYSNQDRKEKKPNKKTENKTKTNETVKWAFVVFVDSIYVSMVTKQSCKPHLPIFDLPSMLIFNS